MRQLSDSPGDGPAVVEIVTDADVCGCVGCHERGVLFEADIPGYGSRVVCADHFRQGLDRVGDSS